MAKPKSPPTAQELRDLLTTLEPVIRHLPPLPEKGEQARQRFLDAMASHNSER